jgi:predicted nucleotidyltransferase component of viral defense system
MLDLKQIETFYPENLRVFKRNLIREYIQYKILEGIFDSKFNAKMVFMGGTAIRILYGNPRFSEDLDFDNLGLKQEDFNELTGFIQKKLKLEGCSSEIKNTFTDVYRAYIRIPDILFNNGLSEHKTEKLLIQVDTEPQNFYYQPDKMIINKFDVFSRISVVPEDIILAQKITAIFMRKRAMGRDFYDVVFLLGKTKPNLDYIKSKLKIMTFVDLKMRLLLKCESLDFKRLANDVEKFLFVPGDVKKVLFFSDFIKDYQF